MTALVKVEIEATLKKEHRLNKSNTELTLLKSLNFEQFIFTRTSLQEINDLYQQSETTST